jgi:hypothetical protein
MSEYELSEAIDEISIQLAEKSTRPVTLSVAEASIIVALLCELRRAREAVAINRSQADKASEEDDFDYGYYTALARVDAAMRREE